ncbi:MAG: leucyl aminopeptidase [Candidatus Rifleibacteriota bacterium]
MKIDLLSKPLAEIQTKALVLTVFEDEKDKNIYCFDENLNNRLNKLISCGELTGRYKEFTMIHTEGFNADRVLIMGLGKRKDFSLERLMAVSAVAARNIRRVNLEEMTVACDLNLLEISGEEGCKAIVEGICLGLYKFRKYTQSEQKDYRAIKQLSIAIIGKVVTYSMREAAEKGQLLSETTNMVRDLVNMPANFLTPSTFAERAEKIASDTGLIIRVLDKEEIANERMNALLAVNGGSAEPPKLVVLEHRGSLPDDKYLGLVGKGVTFDSGGLSLKDRQSMFRMHCDMAGAAAVLGAMECIARKNLPINVVAVMPLTENLVDSHSYKVGDVVTSREGKTIEILNTDAEGRLLLADALSYIRSYWQLDSLVDIATLTGAIVSSLGHFVSGAMTNNKEFYEKMKLASEISCEKIWELPLFDDYKAQIQSDIADLENTGGSPAGSITAAIFLREFVGDVPWVHLDIAGTAWMDESTMTYMKNPFLPKEGGTGVGTRLLYHLAEIMAGAKTN